MDLIEVLDGGMLTTVQDLGRYGYQRYGVPVSGALDQFALRAGQRLVGNADEAAGLEITLIGPHLRFLSPTVMAITGANLDPRLDGRSVPMWQAVTVDEGTILAFGDVRDGVRAYLAVAGGLDVPPVLCSRSTYTRSKLGGIEGRPIKAGDRLPGVAVPVIEGARSRRLPRRLVPTYGHRHALRVILGPQDDAFSEEGLRAFLTSTYEVSEQSDRIGYRLKGPTIGHRASPDIISDGIPLGAVQVPADGQPIVLLADRGTTGGYTKIATVISTDLPRLAQAMPADQVTFSEVSLEDAHAALCEQEEYLDQIETVDPAAERVRIVRAVAAAAAVARTRGHRGDRRP
jgi:antagonist of KipI